MSLKKGVFSKIGSWLSDEKKENEQSQHFPTYLTGKKKDEIKNPKKFTQIEIQNIMTLFIEINDEDPMLCYRINSNIPKYL